MINIFTNEYRSLAFCFLMAICIAVSGCASTDSNSQGKPLPLITFEHMNTLPLDVKAIEIVNEYDPAADPLDVSSQFPTPPDVALKQYAEKRFRASGLNDKFRFIIESSRIYKESIAPENGFMKWVNVTGKHKYEIYIKIRLYTETALFQEGEHSIMTFRRTLTVPQSMSVADREFEQLRALETLLATIDEAVTATIRDKLNILPSGTVL